MSDNFTVNSASGGKTFASDDIAGVDYPIAKQAFGALDSATLAASGAGAVSAGVQRVTLASDDPAVAMLGTIDGHVDGIETLIGTTNTNTAALLTDTQLRASAVPVSLASVPSHAVTNAGTFAVQAAQSGTWTVQPGNTANTTAWKVDGSAVTQPVSLASVPSHAVTNAGTFAVQVDGSALTSLQLIDDPVITDDAAFTPATSKVMMAGFQADESSTDSVDEGDAGAARMTLDRKIITTPEPHTKGGLSIFRSIDLDETEEDVKTSAGQVYGIWFSNLATTTRFLKLYNATAANTTVGSTTPVITLALPGNSSDDISGVFASTHGIAFDTAICAAATTGVADNDTGAPSANDVLVNIFYA